MSREQTFIAPGIAGYVRQVTSREPEALRRLRAEGHPRSDMETSPEQGQFLHLMAHATGARKTIEVGVVRGGGSSSFDLAYIDADKENYPNYYERCLALLRHGGVIAVDNVLWEGSVLDPNDRTADTEAIRAFNRRLHTDDRVAISMLTIG